ncbi:MAG: MTAP family purine nucleoside phosphorylase [Fimbriimonas sp.]
MRADFAIIGGTGIGAHLQAMPGIPLHVPTPFGMVRGKVADGFLILSRHSAGHKVPPHEVNYRGLALACSALRVRGCLASAAVGSLRADWAPGTLALCDQVIDVSARNLTIHSSSVVHQSMTNPFDPGLREAVLSMATVDVQPRACYVNVNGPRFETGAEIRAFGQLGGDVVGMTAGSEAIAMAEAGVPYACLSIVTNFGAGLTLEDPDHHGVVDVMNERAGAVLRLFFDAIARGGGA